MQVVSNKQDLKRFFSGDAHPPGVVDRAGEWLVQENVLTREQLLRALQIQDQIPGIRLGECVVALGYAEQRDVHDIIAVHRALVALEEQPA